MDYSVIFIDVTTRSPVIILIKWFHSYLIYSRLICIFLLLSDILCATLQRALMLGGENPTGLFPKARPF